MPVTIVVGGQFGSEGKGKICAFLADDVQHSVRTGGPNAGHTVANGAKKHVFRHVPCAAVNPSVHLYIGAGGIIDVDLLMQEIQDNGIHASRLSIDPNAVVITDQQRTSEISLVKRIGSTGKGVGAAIASKVMRGDEVLLARDIDCLKPYLADVASALHAALARGERILLEGAQGTGLSLHHGFYPYVTGRETTAGSMCGEAGIGPTAVDRVVLVVRSFPIRVAGNSGPLAGELTWGDVTRRSGYSEPLTEYTTVTGKLRRVGEFNVSDILRAARLNGATEIAFTFADYVDARVRNATDLRDLTEGVRLEISKIEATTEIPVRIISTGPDTLSTVLRNRNTT